jgi:putative glutamine amidotransferase
VTEPHVSHRPAQPVSDAPVFVLLTPDREVRPLRRGPTAFFDLDGRYADAVFDAGAVPVVAPYSTDARVLDALIDRVDALVLTGGDFDVDPALFGEAPHPALGTLKPERTAFERALLSRAEARHMPVLGVCGGMQLMNVTRGGTLWQDLASQHPEAGPHQQVGPKSEAAHDVVVEKTSRLARIMSSDGAPNHALPVNSTHHQAVKTVGRGLVASATTSTGLVEAIEDPALPFYVGVQWHPEAMPNDRQQAIYRALVDAARAFRHGA